MWGFEIMCGSRALTVVRNFEVISDKSEKTESVLVEIMHRNGSLNTIIITL
jgi:hypothetical protein